jgi:PAS domain S-box-containing protein
MMGAEQSNLLHAFFELSDCSMILVDQQEQVVFANPAIHSLLQYAPGIINALPLKALLHPAIAEKTSQRIKAMHNQQEPSLKLNLLLTSSNNDPVPVSAAIKSYQDTYLLLSFTPDPLVNELIGENNKKANQNGKNVPGSSVNQPGFSTKIINTLPGILYIFDFEIFENIYVNDEAIRMLGYCNQDLKNMGVNFLKNTIHPDDYSWFVHDRQKALQDLGPHETREYEYRMLNSQGYWIYIKSKETAFNYDANGKVKQVIGIASDITEQKQAIQRFDNLNNINVTLLNCATQLLDAGPDKLKDEINHTLGQLCEQLNYDNASLYLLDKENQKTNLTYEYYQEVEYKLPESAISFSTEEARWLLNKLANNEVVIYNDVNNLPGEFENILLLSNKIGIKAFVAVPILRQNELIGYIVFVHFQQVNPTEKDIAIQLRLLGNIFANVLKRIQTQSQLEQSRDEYKMLADNITDMVSLHRTDGTCTYTTPSVKSVLGISQEEYINTLAFDLYHPDDASIGYAQMQKAMAGEKVQFRFRTWNKEKGKYIWVEATGQSVFDATTGNHHLLAVTRNIDDLVKKDEQLKLVHHLFDHINDAVQISDEQGNFVYLNSSAESNLGYSREELLKMNVRDIEAIFAGEGSWEKHVEELKSGKPILIEGTHLNSGGNKIPVEASVRHIEVNNQHYVAAVIRDISERKKKEEQIKSSEAYLKALLNSGEKAVYAFDLDKNLIFANDFYKSVVEQITGKPVTAGNEVTSHIPAELVRAFKKNSARTLAGETFTSVSRFNLNDGTTLWAEFYYSPIIMDHEVKGGVVTGRNVTDEIEAREAINAARERLQIATSVAGIGIWETDASFTNLFWDETMRSIYRVKQSQPADFDLWKQFILPEDFKKFKAGLRRAVKNKKSYQTELRLVNRFKRPTRYIRSFAKPLLNDHGQVYTIIGAHFDITDIRQAETELRKSNSELKKINAELDQFVYSTSHDLRAPLTSVMGILELMKFSDSSECKHYIKLIERSVFRLDETIHEIIEYSKNSRVELKVEPIDFNWLLNDILDSLSFMDQVKNIDVQINIKEDYPFHSDPGRVRVILNNLISNGIKYADINKEHPFISISVDITLEQALIEIKDNGIGIAEEQLEKIFEMFYRATDHSSGSGLGLYIVKEAVKKLDGEILVTGKQNDGATFTATFPNKLKN